MKKEFITFVFSALITETEIIFSVVVFHERQSYHDNELLMILRLELCIMLHMKAFFAKCKADVVKQKILLLII